MHVNGHRLPALLTHLLENGRWHAGNAAQALWTATGFDPRASLCFLDVPGMSRETKGARSVADSDQASHYGLMHTRARDLNPGFLDAAQLVVIAVDRDENIICLDYSQNPEMPSVKCSQYPAGCGSVQWHEISLTFETFASIIGLNKEKG